MSGPATSPAPPSALALLCSLAVLVTGASARAERFANQFCEFQLPPNWKCLLEGADWVCQSEDASKKKDAIIVLAAKMKGDQDSFDRYTAYLNKARVFQAPGGKQITSQAKYVTNKKLGSQLWVDSLHLDSEIPSFFTRYLATVYEDIGVLVTYSVNKAKHQEYSKQFEDMVASLKVFHIHGPGLNARTDLFPENSRVTSAILNPQVSPDTAPPTEARPLANVPGAGLGLGGILVIALGAAGFYLWRRRSASARSPTA